MITSVKDLKKPAFAVIEGGKGPNEPNKPWLLDIPLNSIFLVKDRESVEPLLQEYHLIHKTDVSCMLYTNIEDNERFFWVPAEEFSKRMLLQEILITIE